MFDVRWLCRFTLLVLLAATPGEVFGQTPSEATDPPETPAPAEGTIEVYTAVEDADIAERLRSILETTERYEDVQVRVREGVVFLDGVAQSESDKEWASKVGQRTEAVVGVVNDLEVRVDVPPWWDIGEAVDTLEAMARNVIRSLPMVGIGLVIFIITLFASKGVGLLAQRLLRQRIPNALVRSVIVKIFVLAVIFAGVYVFLQVSGLTRLAVTILGGTGVLGLILGFAFRDIAENFLASLLISIERPFRIGDTVNVADHTGVVRRVTTRGTLLIDFDGNHILISNSTVFKSTLTNFTTNPKMRVRFQIGIGYDADVSQAREIAVEVMRAHSAILDDPEPLVLVDTLGGASIVLEFAFWIDGQEYSKLKVRSSVMRQAVTAFDAAGISLPDEDREVIFANPLQVEMQRKSRLESDETTSASDPQDEPRPSAEERRAAALSVEPDEDLKSEVGDLEQQARESRESESGEDLLSDSEEESEEERRSSGVRV